MTNTSRTLKYFRDLGYKCEVVERFLSYAGNFGQRKDLFNIIDIIAIKDAEIIGIQSCGQSYAEHDRKILAEPLTKEWLKGNRKLILISWRKIKAKRGGKQMLWKPRIKEYTKSQLQD